MLPQHRAARFQWAQNHLQWQNFNWENCFFSDETKINLYHSDGRQTVWRGNNERFVEANMAPQEAFGGGGLMVWGGIIRNGKSELFITRGSINAQVYRDFCINDIVVPFAENFGNNMIYVDDNARPHRAAIVTNALNLNNITSLHLPAKSPDLNPIEHTWSNLKLRIRKRENPPQTIAQLEAAIREEWDNIPQNFINTLIDSMPRRCRMVVNRRGGPTKY